MEMENFSSNLNFFLLKKESAPIAYSYPPKESQKNSTDFSLTKAQKTEVNAAQLGIYSIEQIKQKGLKVLELQDFLPISKGSYINGQYSSRVIYLENGSVSQEFGSTLIGRFIINQEYRVHGQPSLSNQNSSVGQFPVNGQYYLQGAYRNQIPINSTQVMNGQYATSHKDIVNQQFTFSGILNAKGDILEGGPFFISKAELLNGRYQVQIQNLEGSTLQVGGQNIQIGTIQTEQGQLLVNGINSVQGRIRPLNQFTQLATLYIEGSYNSEGLYEINGITLENGSNQIATRYKAGNSQGTSPAILEGRYTSGGQFIVTDSSQAIPSHTTAISPSTFDLIQKRLQETFHAYTHPLPGKILKLNG